MEWIDPIVRIVFIVLSTVVTLYVIPWLKEKRLYDTVRTLVEAAQKLAENNPLDKKSWVVAQLRGIGVEVTPFVEAIIESAVKQLDLAEQMSSSMEIVGLAGEGMETGKRGG